MINVSPAFSWSVAACQVEGTPPNLSGVQLRSLKSAKRDYWSFRQENSMNYILHLLHFLIQMVLLLASQEAIFIKPQVLSNKKLSANWKWQVLCFGLIVSGVGSGGVGGCSLWQTKCVWLDV